MNLFDDRYELCRELGRGSTGTVWEARDTKSSETVALKILEPRVLASRQARRRFVREVKAASVLRHPHVVNVRAHGETADGGAYLVMECLAGQTLAARLRETGPLLQPQAIRIAAQVLEAVLAAHRLGIVHRDLKPGNVMLVERDGDPDFVKVLDFGLAKDIERDSYDGPEDCRGALAAELTSVTTEHGHICGTPEYMAPEQARGEPVDERADLYAIGVMLYHTLVGRPPFLGRSPLAVVSLHLTVPPPRPSTLRPDLEIFPPLENLILRCLAKDRAERPSSADVFHADLLRIERDLARVVGRRAERSSAGPFENTTVTLAPVLTTTRRRANALAVVALSLVAAGGASAALWRNATASMPADARMARNERPELARPTSPPALSIRTPEGTAIPNRAASTVTPSALTARDVVAAREAASVRPKPAAVRVKTSLERASEVLASGRVAEACALGERAAQEARGSPGLWKFLGGCFMRLGDREKGVAYYRRYLEVAPSSSDAVFVREMIR